MLTDGWIVRGGYPQFAPDDDWPIWLVLGGAAASAQAPAEGPHLAMTLVAESERPRAGEVAQRGVGEEQRQDAEQTDAHRAARDQQQVGRAGVDGVGGAGAGESEPER